MHFGKRRPSGADYEEKQPGPDGLDATLASRCRGAFYPRSRSDLSRGLEPASKPFFSRAIRTVAWAYVLNYASTVDELIAMRQAISRSLKPGGRFVTVNNNPDDPPSNFEADY